MDLKTARLYWEDSYLREFEANVVARERDGMCLYLDATAFYPESGGQPCDTGWINEVAVREVRDEGGLIAHLLEAPVLADRVRGRIAWDRRFDHMQQHSGQHLLSAVLLELYRAPTVGFHIGAEVSTIDLGVGWLGWEQAVLAERRVNELVVRNLPIHATWQDAGEASPLRRAAAREGPIRVVTIEGVDRAACGGTHVRMTGEIGPILIRKLDRAHGGVRLEFVCGLRAVRRARADHDALVAIARLLSTSLDRAAELVAAQARMLEEAEKSRRKLALELAERRGRELYEAATPSGSGFRCAVQRLQGCLGEETRALAQGFCSGGRAVFLAVASQPPALLLAVSGDSGWHAGQLLREALAQAGGKGGGSAQMAQGGSPDAAGLEQAVRRLAEALPPLAEALAGE
ncbi:MAG: DHHA1 domain-containing protein [Bryobacterales bacterium]|nr:DHHA1 domain-containing protein [Bryobacteraceae bacterium]MDW8129906.1 DHHA1 domain-containing protein [Bryobacterales bacterium]